MSDERKLLFVYKADSGLFNTMADIGHKIFSPETYECALCALTHGYFSERTQWRSFVEQLDCHCDFLHRDEFLRQFPADQTPLPAVFVVTGKQVACCLGADDIARCADLPALQEMIRESCCAAP